MTLPRMPSFRLDGRRALVTGGSRGLGLAIAAALAEAGAHVVLTARNAAGVDAAASEIVAAGGSAEGAAVDATDTAAVEDLVARQGPFEVLVNNAGLNRPALLPEVSEADYDAVFAINVKAALFATRAVAAGLVAAGRPGSVITVGSQMGHVGGPKRVVYCATKHAVEGMTKALAWELGPHAIRVNTLCPTFIETDLSRPFLAEPAFRSFVQDRIALGRVGRLEDVMGAAVFLASDASALVTGTALMVDGGWTAQ